MKAYIAEFNRQYPAFLRALVGLGDVLVSTAQTLIVSFGVPMVLVLLLIVEHSRVKHGIQLFEATEALASFAAWALVLLNLTLEFTIHHVEQKERYQAAAAQRASLRLWGIGLAYFMGFRVGARRWEPQALSPAARYRSLLRLITFTILALALAGSMRPAIEQVSNTDATGAPMAWYAALGYIATRSTLADATIWAGGLLFALAAVRGAQGLTAYLAIRVAEITAAMEATPAPMGTEPPSMEGDTQELIPVYQEPLLPESEPLLPEKKALHIATCPHCDWIGQYDNERSATMARNGHIARCKHKLIEVPNGHK